MNRILIFVFAATLLASCGQKGKTPCECNDIKASETADATERQWCLDKMAKDQKFSEEVRDCAIRALGHDPAQVRAEEEKRKIKSGTYTFSTKKSNIGWKGKKPLGEHAGTLKIKSGSFEMAEDGSVNSGSIVIDMTTLTVTDIEDPKGNADLKGHLTAPDFFDVANHPEAKFEIVSSKSIGQNALEVTGNMTIKGKTNSETSSLVVIKSQNVDGQITLAGGFTFDRTKYGVEYGSKSIFDNLGEKFINDEVTLQLTLVGTMK